MVGQHVHSARCKIDRGGFIVVDVKTSVVVIQKSSLSSRTLKARTRPPSTIRDRVDRLYAENARNTSVSATPTDGFCFAPDTKKRAYQQRDKCRARGYGV